MLDDSGINSALATGTPVMVFFYASEPADSSDKKAVKVAKNSDKFEDFMFGDAEVSNLCKEFVCIKIDITKDDNAELAKAFKVRSAPTVIFLSEDGGVLKRVSKSGKPGSVAQLMQAIIDKFDAS
jgi:thiol:disulfide interchange protein